MRLLEKDKLHLKQEIKDILSQVIPCPNTDILNVTAIYDPNLGVITLRYYSLSKDSYVTIFDEEVIDS